MVAMKILLIALTFLVAGCESLFTLPDETAFTLAKERMNVKGDCPGPKVSTGERNEYDAKTHTIYFTAEGRLDYNVKVHEFVHAVSRRCLTPKEREELLARWGTRIIRGL